MGLGVVLETHGGVFGYQPCQGTGQFVLIGLAGCGNGHGQQGVGEHPRLNQDRRIWVAQRVGRLGLGQFGHHTQIPSDGYRLGAQQISQRR